MISPLDVLGHGVVGYILRKVDGTMTIVVKPRSSCEIPSSRTKSFIQITFLSASTTAMYSVPVVASATNFYNLDSHDAAPPAYVITYLDVDQLVSTSADISETVKLSN